MRMNERRCLHTTNEQTNTLSRHERCFNYVLGPKYEVEVKCFNSDFLETNQNCGVWKKKTPRQVLKVFPESSKTFLNIWMEKYSFLFTELKRFLIISEVMAVFIITMCWETDVEDSDSLSDRRNVLTPQSIVEIIKWMCFLRSWYNLMSEVCFFDQRSVFSFHIDQHSRFTLSSFKSLFCFYRKAFYQGVFLPSCTSVVFIHSCFSCVFSVFHLIFFPFGQKRATKVLLCNLSFSSIMSVFVKDVFCRHLL